ncbi:MAG: HDOD domain-containing protein [Nitrospina sp.]|nr:HDOD domain-containing protein [Nitrospina sp.]
MTCLDLKRFLDCPALPTLPEQIAKVLDETGRASAMDYNIVQIIQFDPSIASRVLQVANSRLYGYPAQIGSLQQAAGLLGPGVIKSIILTTPILERYSGEDSQWRVQIDYIRLLKTSAATGAIAGELANVFEGFETDVCFTAGLLHNLGRLALALLEPEPYIRCLRMAEETGKPLLEVEKERLGVTHEEIYSVLSSHWNYPDTLRRNKSAAGKENVAALVDLSARLAAQWGFETLSPAGTGQNGVRELCESLGLSWQAVDARQAELKNYAQQVSGQF